MMLRRPTTNRDRRPSGFTLVELLVTISIITLLASMILVALAGVQETARADRTRAQVARIDALITEKWDSYRSRRVPLPFNLQQKARLGVNGKVELDWFRVNALRELMRMELPDRKTDILVGPTVLPPNYAPASWNAYRRYAAKLIRQRRPEVQMPLNDKAIFKQLDNFWSSDFESAECLYLILSQINDQDSTALSFFSAQEIGDIDNDGMPELLDGWGRPVIFLRRAPGLNWNVATQTLGESNIPGSPQDGESPDPFDPTGVFNKRFQVPTFALYPLIASAGPDKQMEIFADNPGEANRISYGLTTPPNNPFIGLPGHYTDQITIMVGTPQDSNGDGTPGWLDNITNHNLAGS